MRSGTVPQAADGSRLSPEMGRAGPRRHRAGLQRYAPMQAKPSKVAGVPIFETDDTRGSSDGTDAS